MTEVWLTALVAAVWGAAAGLLLGRPAHRLAVAPEQPWRAECPDGHPLPGWLGPARCRGCPGPYGSGHVALPVVAAVLCAALAAATGPRPELAVWLLLTPVGVLLAAVDLRVHRLPDVLTLPLAATAAVLLGVAALLPEHAGRWTGALLGAVALAGGFLALHLISPAGMGFGDVKLALAAGAVLGWYGWGAVFLGAFLGFLLGGLHGLALIALRRGGRRTEMPFGPCLLLGTYCALLAAAHAA
ncbi:prepilin peptidase [Streptomyces abyssomicinicus]|uniref:prepilin peptidase n=1 Tax=Streptomyces abyssomicinicus TaxID=574929 RepID=UPI00124FDCB3|nr:A24 family peptidase [Streptomyces abyssomicinicus]